LPIQKGVKSPQTIIRTIFRKIIIALPYRSGFTLYLLYTAPRSWLLLPTSFHLSSFILSPGKDFDPYKHTVPRFATGQSVSFPSHWLMSSLHGSFIHSSFLHFVRQQHSRQLYKRMTLQSLMHFIQLEGYLNETEYMVSSMLLRTAHNHPT
jgi:hypothetical protein